MTTQNNTLILGKDGQVGRALTRLLGPKALAASRKEADFLDKDFIPKLESWVGGQPIDAVINAAAYTAVDKAEGDGREAAFRVNGEAVGELAEWCRKRKLPLVHYSTDYVFDGLPTPERSPNSTTKSGELRSGFAQAGSGDKPWRETDTPHPINAYGESKLAGEKALAAAGGRYLLIRTSWVYDAHGKNFFTTILRLLQEKEELRVIADQFGAPTYAPHLAKATLSLPPPEGEKILHLCNSGETSWHGFANEIFTLARSRDSSLRCRRVIPIPTSEYPLPAPRPLNSRLDCALAAKLGVTLPSWQAGLKECFEDYAGSGLQNSGT